MTKDVAPPHDYQLWRFGIISPLLYRTDNDPPLHIMMLQLSQKSFTSPRGELRSVSAAAIRDWYYRYEQGGIGALANKKRSDSGKSCVPLPLQTALHELRQSHPQLTIKKLLKKLKNQKLWDGISPSRSALYRFTATHKLNRSPLAVEVPVRSFEYPHFGNLWSADFLHSPKVRCGRYMRKTYLNAIIDDATRYIVVARFHLAEDTRSFLSDLLLAIRRFGIPQRLYTDNGSAYRSNHLAMICAKLRIAMPHTPPYKPRGRGKIERFFRGVREAFLDEYTPVTLQQLNTSFSHWLQEYHNRPHRALGMSPLNRKLIDEGPALRHLAPTQDINDIFRIQTVKKVGSDGCVRMFKRRFEVRDALPGEKIDVYYIPWETDYILIGPDKRIAKIIDTNKNAQRFIKPKRCNNNQKEAE